MNISFHPCVLHACPSHHPRLDHSNYTWNRAQVMKLISSNTKFNPNLSSCSRIETREPPKQAAFSLIWAQFMDVVQKVHKAHGEDVDWPSFTAIFPESPSLGLYFVRIIYHPTAKFRLLPSAMPPLHEGKAVPVLN
jgi:hypothetical protein